MRRAAGFHASAGLAALVALADVAPAQRIEMPVGYRLTWIGARWNVGARVLDTRGQPVAAPLAYRMAYPSIASVNNRGEVVARKPGSTRVWAVSGRDSASALVMVEQWPARFAFSPANIRLDAISARQPIRVLASDSAGVPIAGAISRVSACRSVNERVASIVGDSVVAVGNGSTWIRCSDRGLADSVPVHVQQRAVTASIANKAQLLQRRLSVGDTFSVRVVARDNRSRDVVDARPTWASLNPTTASVDPLTGKGRAIDGGTARIIVQVGDIADTTTVTIEGAPLFGPVTPAATPVDTTTRSRAGMLAQEIFAFENDTAFISLTVTDSAGEQVSLTNVRMRLLDTTVATKVDSARIFARKSGSTYLIATYGAMVDTITVSVRSRAAATTVRSDSAGAESAFIPPPTFQDSIQDYQRVRDNITRTINTNPELASTRQNLVFSTMAVGAVAEHLSRTDQGVIEDRTGALYGGAGSLLLYQRLELAGALRLGTLTSVESVGEDITLTEVDGSLGYFPIRTIGIRGGVVMRGESSEIATATWFIPKVSIVTRFSFIGDVVSTYGAISLLPKASFKGSSTEPAISGSLFSRGGEAGLEFRRSAAHAGITYYVEQITFDESPRIESFSAIRLRLGFNLGR